jgi:hypothetical protein
MAWTLMKHLGVSVWPLCSLQIGLKNQGGIAISLVSLQIFGKVQWEKVLQKIHHKKSYKMSWTKCYKNVCP